MATAARLTIGPDDAARRRVGPVDCGARALLETLRASARAAQLGGRLDLDRGCALIDPPAARAVASYGAALMRALDVAALRPLTFHPRGAAAVAFGEAWALRLVSALRAGDAASAHVLLGGMVRRERRRLVLWLAGRLAAALDAEASASRAGQAAQNDLEPFQASQRSASKPTPFPTTEQT